MADSRKVTVQFLGEDKTLGRTSGSIDGKLGKLGKSFAAFGIAAAAGMAVAVGAAAKGLYEIGQQFDDATDKIRVSTGATGKRLQAFKDDLKSVASNTASPLADVGDAIAGIAQRLDLTGRPLRAVSKQMLDLSRITGTDLSSNVESVSRLFGDWSIKTEDMGMAMDKLFRASQATGLPVDQLAQTMTQFGGPMRQLGFDFETTAALVGKFQKEGVNSSLVMGSMRIALGKMAVAGEPAKETLARVTEEIANAGSASEANRKAIELFGSKAGPDMAAAIREGRFSIRDLHKQISSGRDTIKKATDDTADFGEKWQIIKNRIFIALEPLATKVFDGVGNAMDRLGPHVDRFVKWFRDDAMPEIQRFGDWIRQKAIPALKDFGDWFSKKIAPALKDFAEKHLATVRRGLERLKNEFQENEPEIRRFGQWIKKAAEWTAKNLIPALSKLANGQLKTLFQVVGKVIDIFGIWVRWAGTVAGAIRRVAGVVSNAAKVFGNFLGAVRDKLGAALSFIKAIPGKIKGFFSNAGTLLKTIGGQIVAGLKQGIEGSWHLVTDVVDNLIAKIPKRIREIMGIASPSKVTIKLGKFITEGLVSGLKSGSNSLDRVIDSIAAKVAALSDKVSGLIEKRGGIIDSFTGMQQSVFGADLSNPETGAPASVASLLNYQGQQAAQARQIKSDIAKLHKMGLSNSLIKQFMSQGESGIANLHTLASSGLPSEIGQLNRLNKQTTSTYASTGNAVAGYLGVNADLAQARKDEKRAERLEAVLTKIEKHLGKNEVASATVKGSDLLIAIRREERKGRG